MSRGQPHARDDGRPPELTGHHRHLPRRLPAVTHRGGVPYEVERVVCTRCDETLAERTLRRAEA